MPKQFRQFYRKLWTAAKNIHKIECMFIPSSFFTQHLLLPVGRRNFAEIAELACLCIKHKNCNRVPSGAEHNSRLHSKCYTVSRCARKFYFINGLFRTDFHETYKCSTSLPTDLLYQISPKSDSKCRKCEYKSIYANLQNVGQKLNCSVRTQYVLTEQFLIVIETQRDVLY